MPQIKEAVIVDYLRSAFSRSRPREPERDVFNSLRMDDVLASLIKELIKRTKIKPEEINDVLTGCAIGYGENATLGIQSGEMVTMGQTAEKLFSQTTFTREDMDKWALGSHKKAAKALEEGFFKGEIMPIEVTLADGTKKVIDSDQSIRGDTTLEGLAGLRPAFKPDGEVTAGNSSPLNAAATATVLMSKEKAKEYGLKPLATIVSMGWAGVDPTVMGKGPVPASRMALKHAGMEVKDIDFWEINEAFCIVALNAIKELGIEPEKVNVKGGATAIGHPLGATGARLVGTLARILNSEGGAYGLANACVGGGQGVATILKREDY